MVYVSSFSRSPIPAPLLHFLLFGSPLLLCRMCGIMYRCVLWQPDVIRQINSSFGNVLRVVLIPTIPGSSVVEADVEYDTTASAAQAMVSL